MFLPIIEKRPLCDTAFPPFGGLAFNATGALYHRFLTTGLIRLHGTVIFDVLYVWYNDFAISFRLLVKTIRPDKTFLSGRVALI